MNVATEAKGEQDTCDHNGEANEHEEIALCQASDCMNEFAEDRD
ncbi:MAG: hypothetical protein QOE70_6877 [Chthoniobacter sp.]|nr:hypothetical protein [Chthoniobacter sp.]